MGTLTHTRSVELRGNAAIIQENSLRVKTIFLSLLTFFDFFGTIAHRASGNSAADRRWLRIARPFSPSKTKLQPFEHH